MLKLTVAAVVRRVTLMISPMLTLLFAILYTFMCGLRIYSLSGSAYYGSCHPVPTWLACSQMC